jgi:3-hydroxybutyryl-CoA dehydratase
MTDVLLPVSLTVDTEVIGLYADLTEDYNPLHVDAEFAATSPFGGIIAHGTMSLNLIWQSLTATVGADAARDATLDIRFSKPVRIGDVITAGGTRGEGDHYDVWARNQAGDDVIKGVVRLASASPA